MHGPQLASDVARLKQQVEHEADRAARAEQVSSPKPG